MAGSQLGSSFSGTRLAFSSVTPASRHEPSPKLRVVAVRPEPRKKDEERLKGIFEFVIDNPSSKGAIQLKSDPAADGNLGQLISSTKGKGRDLGGYYMVGDFQYFVRETAPQLGPISLPSKTVVMVHGAPAQSWAYREVMQQMAGKGYKCLAPDFLGFGFSEKPQAGYYFKYTEEAYHAEIDKLLETFEVDKPFLLVVQGFFLGGYALTWALKNPTRLQGIAIMNTPLLPSIGLPNDLASLKLPFVGEFVCQNAVLPERFIEGGSPYTLTEDDSDIYRLPYLDSGEPGFALLEVARKYNPKDVQAKIEKGFSKASGWSVPISVLWGPQDPYLKQADAEVFAKAAGADLKLIDGTGHMPQEDWSEKVTDALSSFFSRCK